MNADATDFERSAGARINARQGPLLAVGQRDRNGRKGRESANSCKSPKGSGDRRVWEPPVHHRLHTRATAQLSRSADNPASREAKQEETFHWDFSAASKRAAVGDRRR